MYKKLAILPLAALSLSACGAKSDTKTVTKYYWGQWNEGNVMKVDATTKNGIITDLHVDETDEVIFGSSISFSGQPTIHDEIDQELASNEFNRETKVIIPQSYNGKGVCYKYQRNVDGLNGDVLTLSVEDETAVIFGTTYTMDETTCKNTNSGFGGRWVGATETNEVFKIIKPKTDIAKRVINMMKLAEETALFTTFKQNIDYTLSKFNVDQNHYKRFVKKNSKKHEKGQPWQYGHEGVPYPSNWWKSVEAVKEQFLNKKVSDVVNIKFYLESEDQPTDEHTPITGATIISAPKIAEAIQLTLKQM